MPRIKIIYKIELHNWQSLKLTAHFLRINHQNKWNNFEIVNLIVTVSDQVLK